jgi:arabinogalactan oligomer/maltooligosaccharide transport system substrate-binding protein
MAVAFRWAASPSYLSDIPTWISAVASLFALVGAGIAAWQAYRIYRLESARDAATRSEQSRRDTLARRSQAGLVSGWWGYAGDGEPDRGDPRHWGAFVRNASELPVFRVTITIVNRASAELAESFNLPAIPPAGEPVFHRLRGAGAQTRLADWVRAGRVFDYRVVLAFTDSSGLRWIRDQHGALHECGDALLVLLDQGRADALGRPLSDFADRYGVRLALRTMDYGDLQPEFLAAVASGDSPDIVVGTHDWLGNLLGHRAVEPVKLPAERREEFRPEALQALTRQGQLWAIPYAIENLALVRNPTLAPDPPATLEELIAAGEALVATGRTSHVLAVQLGMTGDAYHAYPFFAAAGGTLFGSDPEHPEVGLDSPEGIAAFAGLRELGEQGRRVLLRSVTEATAVPLFLTAHTPFLVTGPWALPRLRRGQVPYAISPIPGFSGGPPAAPLVGVAAAYLGKAGRNRELAHHALTELLPHRRGHPDLPGRAPPTCPAGDRGGDRRRHGPVPGGRPARDPDAEWAEYDQCVRRVRRVRPGGRGLCRRGGGRVHRPGRRPGDPPAARPGGGDLAR